METLIRLHSLRAGRDKEFRAVQYALKVITSFNVENKANLQQLEKTLASFRKLLRWGTCLDTLYGVKSSVQLKDPWTMLTVTGSKVALALYLYYDHLVWLHQVKLRIGNVAEWSKKSNGWWAVSILVNLVRDLKEVSSVILRQPSPRTLDAFLKVHKALLNSLVLNLFDLVLPLSALGLLELPNWTVGVCGVTSTALSTLPLIDSSYRK